MPCAPTDPKIKFSFRSQLGNWYESFLEKFFKPIAAFCKIYKSRFDKNEKKNQNHMFINSDLISPRDPEFFSSERGGIATVAPRRTAVKKAVTFFNGNICTNQRSFLILRHQFEFSIIPDCPSTRAKQIIRTR